MFNPGILPGFLFYGLTLIVQSQRYTLQKWAILSSSLLKSVKTKCSCNILQNQSS